MKTIERKPEWPEWAEYYAKDQNGCAYVYSSMPYRDDALYKPDAWAHSGHIAPAAENTHSQVTCRNWKSSLRKIEDHKKYKGMSQEDFVCLVIKLNGLAYDATEEGGLAIMPFRFVSTGDTENSEWDEQHESLREHIIERVHGTSH